MEASRQSPATVLVMAGHDPSGGAGVQADIEAINATGARCATLITALTAQNTARCAEIIPQDAEAFRRQAELLGDDMTFQACKVGLAGDNAIIDAVAALIAVLNGMPVVVDPVLRSGTGDSLAGKAESEAICTRLLPLATVLTPNLDEARRLTGRRDPGAAAKALLEMGCRSVLITGGDDDTGEVINRFYREGALVQDFRWGRFPGRFHGSGCTLSAAIASYLAQGTDLSSAIEQAQEFTWRCIRDAVQLGKGQLHPTRERP